MGGASTRMLNAVKGLQMLGHRITLVSAFPHYPDGDVPNDLRTKALIKNRNGTMETYRVWVPPLPHKGLARRLILYFTFSFSSLFPLLFIGEVDVIWITCPNYFDLIPGLAYKLLKRAPLIFDVVDLWPQALEDVKSINSGFLTKVAKLMCKFFYRFPDAVTTLNSVMKKDVEAMGGQAYVVENVVDTSVFHPMNVKRPKHLENKFIIMYSGNLGIVYDFDTVLMAAKMLSNRSEIIFVIRGNGEQKEYIKKMINELKLKNVILDLDIVRISEVAEKLNMADVFLLPQRGTFNSKSTFPIKVFEYLSVKKPIIVSAKGEIADFIKNINAGIVVEPENSTTLAEAIVALLNSPTLCWAFGERGYDYVREKLSIEKMGQKLVKCSLKVKNQTIS